MYGSLRDQVFESSLIALIQASGFVVWKRGSGMK